MRMGAKKRPSYRVVVKEKLSKRDGAYVENVGFYDPTRNPAEVRLDLARVNYWMENGAQPTDTVRQLIKQQSKAQSNDSTATEEGATSDASAAATTTTTPAA
jgi:small subunit ribosomal protein S16